MKVGIMQPYFLPYLGYFQLIAEVDAFVVYDNIQFSKKGYFHRNRFLQNNTDAYFSLSLKADSDYLDVNQRYLSEQWFSSDAEKLLRKIKELYKKAPYFEESLPIIENIVKYEEPNLFKFLHFSLETLKKHLDIKTPLIQSSRIDIDHSLKAEEKVLAICKNLNADNYTNPIGGLDLYQNAHFIEKGIELKFLKSGLPVYKQFSNNFIPGLSILDILMFNSVSEIQQMLQAFEFVAPK
jgi:hypothetical protein